MIFSQSTVDPSYVKVRWLEPYTSASLNNKSFGVLPVGVYTGFTITPGGLSTRDIVVGPGGVSGQFNTNLNSGYLSGNFDASVGFSVAVIQDPTGFQETVQIPPTHPAYHLDATGLEGQHLFIVLITQYAIGSATTAMVALVDHTFIDQNPWTMVLGFVNVPVNPATPLDSTNFGYNDPNYPRLTPFATPTKGGFMPPSVFGQIGTSTSPWQNLLVMDVDPNSPFVVTITPSQFVTGDNKRIYSYVQASVASKFPRSATAQYNGGIHNDQLTKLNIKTGVIGGAHQVPTNLTFPIPSVSGTPNSYQVGLVSLDPADNINVIYGNNFSTVSGAILDDNLPVAGSSLLQIGAFVVGTDVSGNFLPMNSAVSGSILWRRPYLNVGGGGTGNANELLTRLQDRLVASTFKSLSDNIFTQQGTSKVASSTASFDVANNVYNFKLVGQNIVSTNCLSTDFLALGIDVDTVEVMDFWSVTDPLHLVEVSRDGGVNYQTVPMVQIDTTDTFRGIYTFTDEVVFTTLSSQSVSGTNDAFNVTTAQQRAQQVILGGQFLVTQLVLHFNKVGTPSGSFKVRVVRDNAGFPSTSLLDVLSESEAIQISTLPSGAAPLTVSMPKAVLAAGTYWIVVLPDVIYQGSFSSGVTEIDVGVNNSTVTSSAQFNGTSWSLVTLTAWAYQFNGRTLDLRVRITAGTANTKLEGYGIFYGLITGVVTGKKNIELQQFSGDSNINQFTLTQFTPSADFLKVYYKGSGQVFVYPDFQIDGQVVTFPVNSFNVPGEQLVLRFDQTEGQGFDNSDANAALMADNHLGSTNVNHDRSIPGRGILLRRPDGTLRELSLDNLDQIVISSTP